MKIFALIIILIASTIDVIAQDYLINFSGTGSSTTVETVTVENLTQGKSITLSGLKTLHLVGTVTGNSPLLEYMDYPMIVYPNPSSGDFTVQFEAQKSGMVTVTIYDLIGREINHLRQNVQVGFQSFKVAGLSNGVYTVQVLVDDNKFTQKVVCNSRSTSTASISYNGFSEAKQRETTLKSATTEQAWQYNTGDRLKFQGSSGKYSTIVMDVPTQSKTLSFDFVECTDADGNNYPVVKIGNQLWMAENLKTTKYNDGTPILNETDNLKWSNLTEGGYCWYNNDINNKIAYGALYNWFAVSTNKLAPTGWHVAKNTEWADLITYMGGEGEAIWKLKENGPIHWQSSNINATNEYGFAALPGGTRMFNKQYSVFGPFGNLKTAGNWWSMSEFDNSNSWYTNVSQTNMYRGYAEKQNGYSARCIWGDLPTIKTSQITDIKADAASTGGNITNNGGLPIIEKGICWSTQHNPTISNFKIKDENEGNSYNCILNELIQNTTYFVRAFAINDLGISYGNEESFTTLRSPILEFKSNKKDAFVGLDTITISWNIEKGINATLIYGDVKRVISEDGNYSFVPTEEKNYLFTIEAQHDDKQIDKTITVISSIKRDDFCGVQRIEYASIWSNPDQTFSQTYDNGKTWIEVTDKKAFPVLFGQYVSVNALWRGVLSDFQRLCKKTYMIEPDKFNASFNWDIQDSTTSGCPGITTGVMGPNGLDKSGTTTTNLPIQVKDIKENCSLEFETIFSFPSCDVFLIDMWFYPEKNANINRTKELMFTLNKVPDKCFKGPPTDKINFAGYNWLTYSTTNFGKEEPNPSFPNDPSSFYWSKGFYLESPLMPTPVNNTFSLKLRPVLDYLIKIGFINETDWLGIISTGVEPKIGVGFLDLKNYRIKFN